MKRSMQALIIVLLYCAIFFASGKVDYHVMRGMNEQPTIEKNPCLHDYWFWMWTVLLHLISVSMGITYYIASPRKKKDLEFAAGIALTGIILFHFQLEDLFYFGTNPALDTVFPTGNWTWMPQYRQIGVWTTPMHFAWLLTGISIVSAMWYLILKK